MLTLYRSNRAEFLAAVLARQLLDDPPGPFDTVEVLVNTWPTSRWLGEQLAAANGISSLVRFPFPGSRLRQLVRQVLELPEREDDPWRATTLVWSVLELLPGLLEEPQAGPLRDWLNRRETGQAIAASAGLTRDRWQLARAIADAFDDYALYRPELMGAWLAGSEATPEDWQPLLIRQLAERLPREPFGLQVHRAVERLRSGMVDTAVLPPVLRLFGISALAPVQVQLVQALSGCIDVQVYLLTPCRDLWQRVGSRRQQLGEAWSEPPDGQWLLQAPRLEATLGRMGAEFQQLLEGSGESQLGEWREGDLFADPVAIAAAQDRSPSLLEQLQQQLVDPEASGELHRNSEDTSLLFQAAPGPWREVQLVRDRILQWLAEDPQLEPRDVLVMTPQIDRYAPLLRSVFNDTAATGVDLPWRLTDRSQGSTPGLTMAFLELLDLAGGRLTATGLERLLANPALQQQQRFSAEEAAAITRTLQRTGFRWGLDRVERGGEETHSLCWCLDRWLLGLVLAQRDGDAPGGAAPFHQELDPQRLVLWWQLLDRLVQALKALRQSRCCTAWVELLQQLLQDLFGDGGTWSWERQCWFEALEDWRLRAGEFEPELEVAVATEVLKEALSVDSGRFGHRSGALTVSALEPMRAIPHKVIALIGLDGQDFPRPDRRPGFHLLEQRRLLGDPRGGDQDRYALLEALMSARSHLLISWCGRHEHTGEQRPAAVPVEQWLADLSSQLGEAASRGLRIDPPPNPLDRRNFLSMDAVAPLSCDRRQLQALQWIEHNPPKRTQGLALPLSWAAPLRSEEEKRLSHDSLVRWLVNPQSEWLRQLGLFAGERIDAVEDLEALQLDGLQQFKLLDRHLEESLLSGDSPDWCSFLRGQGVLPAAAGAELEAQKLHKRLHGLQQCLRQLGEPRREGGVLFAGDVHVVVEPGTLRPRALMRCWAQHLLLSAQGEGFGSSAVISRAERGDGAQVQLRWQPLTIQQAEMELDNLQHLAQDGLKRCWPVPPRSGWVLMAREQRKRGSGVAAFRSCWQQERDKPEQRLCFGAEIEADDLLQSDGFSEACEALYRAMLTARLA